MRSLEARIVAHGIPAGGWFLLRVLWDQDDLTQIELSERMGVMAPTTFRAVSSLEALGLVTRTRNESDARCTRVRLTAKGRALENDLIPHSVEVMNIALSGLTRAEVSTLQRAIARMLSNLEADPRLSATAGLPETPPPRRRSRRLSLSK